MAARDNPLGARNASRILLASSNEGKLREYRRMAAGSGIEFDWLRGFGELPVFDETAATFAENSAGKALHYSLFTQEMVLADDSGLVVPALGGAPGVQSARYAGPGASDGDRVRKLLGELDAIGGGDRQARFVCVISVAQQGRAVAVVSGSAEGSIARGPRGVGGFGYDPVFLSEELGRTFAEASEEEKDRLSHRGKAFRRLLEFLRTRKVS